ncbi:lasso peptide biosynthesis B2 protein [Nonomuraea sp. NPDC049714]|uniref:lasso peptide biosynthesis B2 protein n=1 Tax=Nonomuraea sp. NPDC049714 TaxID=3364357 RepID=UPI003792A8EA
MTVRARAAVGLAFLACRVSPEALRRLLERVTRNGRRPELSDIVRYREAVVSVSSVCAGEGCLPRSVATVLLSRSYGYGLSWCTGIRDAPFAAHAWVEVDGRAVGEPDDIVSFQKMLTVVPKYSLTLGPGDAPVREGSVE